MAQNDPSLIALMAKNSLEKAKDYVASKESGKPDEHIVVKDDEPEKTAQPNAMPKSAEELLQAARGLGKMGIQNVKSLNGALTNTLENAKMEQRKEIATRFAGKVQAAKTVDQSYKGTSVAPGDDSEAIAHSQGNGMSNDEMKGALASDVDAQQNSSADTVDQTDAVKNANVIANQGKAAHMPMMRKLGMDIAEKAQMVVNKASEVAAKISGKLPAGFNKTIGDSGVTYGAAIVMGVVGSLVVLAVYKIFKWVTKGGKKEYATEGLALLEDNSFNMLTEAMVPLMEGQEAGFSAKIMGKAAKPAHEMASYVAEHPEEHSKWSSFFKFVSIAALAVAAGIGVWFVGSSIQNVADEINIAGQRVRNSVDGINSNGIEHGLKSIYNGLNNIALTNAEIAKDPSALGKATNREFFGDIQ